MLESAGSSLDEVTKVTIYMVHLAELLEMNDIFNQYPGRDSPALMTSKHSRFVGDARGDRGDRVRRVSVAMTLTPRKTQR